MASNCAICGEWLAPCKCRWASDELANLKAQLDAVTCERDALRAAHEDLEFKFSILTPALLAFYHAPQQLAKPYHDLRDAILEALGVDKTVREVPKP